jgi:hypothetical protein
MINKYFKTICSTLIIGVFLFLAFGSGESSSGNDELNKKSSDEIIAILCKNELTDNTDVAGGVVQIKISLQMSTDKTFKYAIQEEYDPNAFAGNSSLNATGTFELVGNVQKADTPGWTNKYGEDAGKFQYEQKIKFTGSTNDGKSFNLNATLVQFGDKNGMESKWFFTHEDYSLSNQESVSVENFRLPDEFIYP